MEQRETLAYAAGIIDGEGTITLASYRGRYKGELSQATKYRVMVLVTNTDRVLVDFLRINFGGVIATLKKKPGCKQAWQWRLSSRKAEELLVLLQPYLLLKLPQAKLAITFNARRHQGVKGQANERRTVLDQADKILMLSLNKRGSEENSHGL